jgi:hypothetical protein
MMASERTDMPMHDWKKVEAGIFRAFHHDWITAIGLVGLDKGGAKKGADHVQESCMCAAQLDKLAVF